MNPNIPTKKVHNINTPANKIHTIISRYSVNRKKKTHKTINKIQLMLSLTLNIVSKIFWHMLTIRIITGENKINKKTPETKRRSKQIAAKTRPRNSVNKQENDSHKLNSARLTRDAL